MSELDEITQLLLQDYGKGRTVDTTVSVGHPTLAIAWELIEKLRILLFPGFYRDGSPVSLESNTSMLISDIYFRLRSILLPMTNGDAEKCRHICIGFLQDIPRIRGLLQQDLQSFVAGDPAVTCEAEIITAYPGF